MAKRSVFQELYNWFYLSYGKASKETLLELMKDDVDIQRLRRFSQRELAEFYCQGLVYSALGPDAWAIRWPITFSRNLARDFTHYLSEHTKEDRNV